MPMHLQECFAYLGHEPAHFPESERAANETLALPVHPELTDEQARYVVECDRASRGCASASASAAVHQPQAESVIGVISRPDQRPVVEEFFELFKTPWEFYQPGRTYDVVVATADEFRRRRDRGLLVVLRLRHEDRRRGTASR